MDEFECVRCSGDRYLDGTPEEKVSVESFAS
jgi:hypothetical protein